jgi:hypothetical protein
MKLQLQKKSILDGALSQISSMKTRIPATDQARLDQYLTSVREVEVKVNNMTTTVTGPSCPVPSTTPQNYDPGNDSQFANYIKAQIDLITPFANLLLGLSNVASVGLTSFANSKAAINLKA